MDNVENFNDNLLHCPKMTSLSGGMEILPGMRSEKLYFKPIIYPEEWDQYKGLSQTDIINKYLLKVSKAGTDDPKELLILMKELSDSVDWDIHCYERDQIDVDDSYNATQCMIYARILELGVWDAHCVTLYFTSNYKSVLDPFANLLLYNQTPVSPQILPIAALYVDLLFTLKGCEGEYSCSIINDIHIAHHDHPHMISAMEEEIKSEPFPTANYLTWAFEKASYNLEAQK